MEEKVESFRRDFQAVKSEINKVIVGHDEIIDGILYSLFADGHVLLEGVPGLGKTKMIRTLSEILALSFSRIQFTPDLMPADIIGTNIISQTPSGEKFFQFQKGPIFAQVVLADEINRATPKTQSALLEAMQEHTATVAGISYKLQEPFFVLATQNPIEMEGTYPLPEAQLDRFIFKLKLKYPTEGELFEILNRTTSVEEPKLFQVLNSDRIMQMRDFVRQVHIASHVRTYLIKLILATHPNSEFASEMAQKYVRYGSSPRGAQAIELTAKVRALIDGRYNIAFEDIKSLARPALRHRTILNYEGAAEGLDSDLIVEAAIQKADSTL